MHFVATTLYYIHMNKDVKDYGKESEISYTIYGFLVKDWMKTLLDKLSKEEEVTENREGPKVKDVEELDNKEGN